MPMYEYIIRGWNAPEYCFFTWQAYMYLTVPGVYCTVCA